MSDKIYATTPLGEAGRWYSENEPEVRALAWSPDSKYIVAGQSDHKVRVWDATTGDILVTYQEHTSRINAVAWSPDGQYIASGSQDHSVRVWAAPLA